jgi:outer membrane lipoprotein-sorting protein
MRGLLRVLEWAQAAGSALARGLGALRARGGAAGWLVAGAAALQAADTNAFLTAWLDAQRGLRTWSASFTQTRALAALREPLRTPGRLWFAAPDRFRWELGEPPQTIALRRTNELWVIYPRLKRAERYPLSAAGGEAWRDALALLDAGFPGSRTEFEARFRLLGLAETNGLTTVRLEPRRAPARKFMREIRLTLRASDLGLVANELHFADGSRLRNDFTNAVANAPIPPERFEPALPADARVVEPAQP